MHSSIDGFYCSTTRGLHVKEPNRIFVVILCSANYGAQVKQTGPKPDVNQLKARWYLVM